MKENDYPGQENWRQWMEINKFAVEEKDEREVYGVKEEINASPRKAATLKFRDKSKRAIRKETKLNKEEKNRQKGKTPRLTEEGKQRKIRKELRRDKNRKAKSTVSEAVFVDYALTEPAKTVQPNTQTKETFLGEKKVASITREAERVFGDK